MHRSVKKYSKQSTSKYLRLWAFGFTAYLILAINMSSEDDWLSRFPDNQARIFGLIFIASLLLTIGTTAYIALKLRAELTNSDLSSEQRLVGSFAIASFVGTVIALFLPIFGAGALVLGIVALRRTSTFSSHDLQEVLAYRSLSLYAVIASSVFFMATVILKSN